MANIHREKDDVRPTNDRHVITIKLGRSCTWRWLHVPRSQIFLVAALALLCLNALQNNPLLTAHLQVVQVDSSRPATDSSQVELLAEVGVQQRLCPYSEFLRLLRVLRICSSKQILPVGRISDYACGKQRDALSQILEAAVRLSSSGLVFLNLQRRNNRFQCPDVGILSHSFQGLLTGQVRAPETMRIETPSRAQNH